MSGTLIILGLTLYLVGTVGCMRDASEKGKTSLIFLLPLASFHYVHQHWSDIWLAAMVRVVGVVFTLTGVVFYIVDDPQVLKNPERLLYVPHSVEVHGTKQVARGPVVNTEEAIRIALRNDDNPYLTGQILGKRFMYDRVDIINGVITIKQGKTFISDLEVRIFTGIDESKIRERQTFYVQPEDENPPEVHITWLPEGERLPQTRIIKGGYRMELHLARLDRYQLNGFLQLLLPDEDHSFLSGEFVGYDSHIRYINGTVDITYDHVDTLKHVAFEYLQSQYPEKAIDQIDYTQAWFKRSSGKAEVTAKVTLKNGRVELRRVPMEKTDLGWLTQNNAVEVLVLQDKRNESLIVRSDIETTSLATQDQVDLTPRDVPFEQLSLLAGEAVTTERIDGKTQSGIVKGIRKGRFVVEAQVGSGTVEYFVKQDELAAVILSTGQRWNVIVEEGERDAPAAEPVEEEAVVQEPGVEDVPQEAVSLVNDLSALVGKRVRITSKDSREKVGVLKEASTREIVLETQVGASLLEYYYKPGEITKIEELSSQ